MRGQLLYIVRPDGELWCIIESAWQPVGGTILTRWLMLKQSRTHTTKEFDAAATDVLPIIDHLWPLFSAFIDTFLVRAKSSEKDGLFKGFKLTILV